ncbi:MAG: ATP-binding cassette domain-containing protein [Chloroflexi bacterium]|nr:ATP-binding cassette domain-containing protein [Chloroflexota bacterium]
MQPIIRTDSVTFRYPQRPKATAPLTLAIERGETVLISGPSGTGKSTLARCLTGLIPHLYHGDFQGSVWIDELDTHITPMWKLAERIGFVLQNPAAQMVTATVQEELLFGLENLGMTQAEIRQRLDEAIAQFQLDPFLNRSPQSLSGGEQQKLCLASIFARKPHIFVLDEPLSMLDTTSAIELVEDLQHQADAGASVVVCEHKADFLKSFSNLRVEKLAPNQSALPFIDDPMPAKKSLKAPMRLSIKDLVVRKNSHLILKGINCEIESGKVVAVIGRNGVGKTTLFRAMAGFTAFEGEIKIEGSPEKPHFGIVFQNPDMQLFNGSVRDEILYHIAEPNFNRYMWLIKMLELEQYENTPPLLLSEGEKRRVALATILMRNSKNGILLDEPALGQDTGHKMLLMRLLRALAEQGMFVIMSTHDIDLALQADHLILLGKEGIAAQGNARQVFDDTAAWNQIGLVKPAWVHLP